MSSSECPICTLSYTSSTRKRISCSGCDLSYCLTCLKRYLETCPLHVTAQGDIRATCMNPGCNNALDRKFLIQHLPGTFHQKVYRSRETEAQMATENALLARPDLQAQAACEKQLVTNQPAILELRAQARELARAMRENKNRAGYLSYGLRPELYVPGVEAWQQKRGQERELRREQELRTAPVGAGNSGPAPRRTAPRFVHRCPVGDCRGTLAPNYECHLCHTKCCRSCLEPKEAGHSCDAAAVANVREIRRSCKPCPNPDCGLPTQRSAGCSQMWCIGCQKFWNWNTGEIQEGGFRHNPEYLRWLQDSRTGLAGGGGGCGVDYGRVRSSFIDRQKRKYWQEVLRVGHHLHDARRDLLGNRGRAQAPHERNSDLAVRYLAGRLSRKRWETAVKTRRKKSDRVAEEREALEFMHTVIQAQVANACAAPDREGEFREALAGAATEFNAQMDALSLAYKVSTLKLAPPGRWGAPGEVGGALVRDRRKRSRGKR